MSDASYRTAPDATSKMPGGIPYIIGNEAAERFSYYGMRAILVVYMTQYLRGANGELELLSETDATTYYHLFTAAVYFTPLAGALLADVFLGKYRTIVTLSIVYCLGHVALAMDDTFYGLALGLGLISVGSGGIKPCVSAHVGDQFGDENSNLLSRVYSYFYFSINLGAFISTLATPLLLEHYGPHFAFGLPGALMIIATWVFWLGRQRFIHIPPGGKAFLKELFSAEAVSALLRLGVNVGPSSRSYGPQLPRTRVASFPGPGLEPASDPGLHPALPESDLPRSRADRAADPATQDRRGALHDEQFILNQCVDRNLDRRGPDAEHRLADRRLRDPDCRRSARLCDRPGVFVHPGAPQD